MQTRRSKRTFSWATFGLTGVLAAPGGFTLPAAEQNEPAIAQSAASDIAEGPKIQLETNFFDFGKLTAAETLSGVFKFKNVGTGALTIGHIETSCDCTEAIAKPATVPPGERGEVVFTIKMDRPLKGQRHIMVPSNDPKTPHTQLIIQMDYTPLYELSPMRLQMGVPAGKAETVGSFKIMRVDGKPLEIDRLTASSEWITAEFDRSFKPQNSSARINVILHRPSGPPAPVAGSVQMWKSSEADHPVRTLTVTGEIQGELAANPARFDWAVADFGKNINDYPPESLTRTVELKSMLGNPVEIKSVSSDIKGLSVKVEPKEPGKRYDLVLKFDQLPREYSQGKVTVETSLASLPKLDVFVTVSVPSDK